MLKYLIYLLENKKIIKKIGDILWNLKMLFKTDIHKDFSTQQIEKEN